MGDLSFLHTFPTQHASWSGIYNTMFSTGHSLHEIQIVFQFLNNSLYVCSDEEHCRYIHRTARLIQHLPLLILLEIFEDFSLSSDTDTRHGRSATWSTGLEFTKTPQRSVGACESLHFFHPFRFLPIIILHVILESVPGRYGSALQWYTHTMVEMVIQDCTT